VNFTLIGVKTGSIFADENNPTGHLPSAALAVADVLSLIPQKYSTVFVPRSSLDTSTAVPEVLVTESLIS